MNSCVRIQTDAGKHARMVRSQARFFSEETAHGFMNQMTMMFLSFDHPSLCVFLSDTRVLRRKLPELSGRKEIRIIMKPWMRLTGKYSLFHSNG